MSRVVLEGFGLLSRDPDAEVTLQRRTLPLRRILPGTPGIAPPRPDVESFVSRPLPSFDLPGNTGVVPPGLQIERLPPRPPLPEERDGAPMPMAPALPMAPVSVPSTQVLPSVATLPGSTGGVPVTVASGPASPLPPQAFPLGMNPVGSWFDQELIPGVKNKWLAAGVGGLLLVLLLAGKREA